MNFFKFLSLQEININNKYTKIMSLEEVIKSGNYELIDVREPMELEMDGNIDGAKNIPLGEVEDRQDEILSIEKPVILFCRSGNRSGKALE